jgi:hypothetical protein
LVSTPADSVSVISRNRIARPDMISGRSGRISLTINAAMAGTAIAHAIHIAPSRAMPASQLNLSGKLRVCGS